MSKVPSKLKRLTLCPDYESPWGLWSDYSLVAPVRGEYLTPAHFNLSAGLTTRLNSWLCLWKDNFADAPEEESHTWRQGFDKFSWVEEGDAIATSIEEELPGYTVVRDYRSYLKSATR